MQLLYDGKYKAILIYLQGLFQVYGSQSTFVITSLYPHLSSFYDIL